MSPPQLCGTFTPPEPVDGRRRDEGGRSSDTDPPDRPDGALVGEPDVAVRARPDPTREAARVQTAGERGDRVRGGIHHVDRRGRALVAEPEVAVRAYRDPAQAGARVQATAELADGVRGRVD